MAHLLATKTMWTKMKLPPTESAKIEKRGPLPAVREEHDGCLPAVWMEIRVKTAQQALRPVYKDSAMLLRQQAV